MGKNTFKEDVPQDFRSFDERYCFERGINIPIYPDGDFALIANGLQKGTGGQLGSQHGYQNGDPFWAGRPQGENYAGGLRALASPFGDSPFAINPNFVSVPVPEEDLRDDQAAILRQKKLPRLTPT